VTAFGSVRMGKRGGVGGEKAKPLRLRIAAAVAVFSEGSTKRC